MRLLITTLGCLSLLSCSQQNDTMTRYHENGMAKPVIAVAPMIDTTTFDAPWSVSEELTSLIVGKMASGSRVFVEAQEDDAFADNPFGGDLSWVKREFHSHEFLVFMELVEHEIVPVKGQENLPRNEVSTNLNMSVRVRVLDLRGNEPKIVLQEMVKHSYFIPKTLIPTDYTQDVWGTEAFKKSPMGIAHAQIVEEIASRANDYILLAKSK